MNSIISSYVTFYMEGNNYPPKFEIYRVCSKIWKRGLPPTTLRRLPEGES